MSEKKKRSYRRDDDNKNDNNTDFDWMGWLGTVYLVLSYPLETGKHSRKGIMAYSYIRVNAWFLLLVTLLSTALDLATAQNTKEVNVVSCRENEINPGTVIVDCETKCMALTGEYNATDFSTGPTDSDPRVIRTLSCNCSVSDIFNCLEQ
jgi:hypothetical protein